MTTTPIQMRFADVDMLGHVNNVSQQHYFDVGKSDFFAQVLDPAPNWKQEGLITVSTYNDYLAQIRYGEPIAVLTRIEKVGNKSFTLFQQIVNTATQEVKTQSRSVLVAFDFVAQVSIPLLEPWRKSFEKQL